MTTKQFKLLDLFCKAGGCTRGYQQAGFYVVGVDIETQPHYIGDDFILGDALDALDRLLRGEKVQGASGRWYGLEDLAAFHASPPCQKYGKTKHLAGDSPKLIEPVRERLVRTGKPYIIENVPGAPLIDPVLLTAAMFSMNILRDRLFECSFPVPFILSPSALPPVKMGRPVSDGEVLQPVGHFSNVPYAREQMGIDWMVQGELAEAIPPAYTNFVGGHLMDYILAEAAV